MDTGRKVLLVSMITKQLSLKLPLQQLHTVTGKADGCPGTANMTVRINRQIMGLSVTDTTICPNEPVKVEIICFCNIQYIMVSWRKTSCKDCPTTQF